MFHNIILRSEYYGELSAYVLIVIPCISDEHIIIFLPIGRSLYAVCRQLLFILVLQCPGFNDDLSYKPPFAQVVNTLKRNFSF